MITAVEWASSTFGDIDLGHVWRRERWLAMAATAAEQPSGRITECFGDGAARQASYKLLERGVSHAEVIRCCARAALRDSTGSVVIVPIDQSTLTLGAATAEKGFGRVGTSASQSFGAESMHAVALSEAGAPLGVLAQRLWVRTGPTRRRARDSRTLPLDAKESRYWVEAARDAHAAWVSSGLSSPLWFQLDAGGDAAQVLEKLFVLEGAFVTVRNRQDRRLLDGEQGMLHETLLQQRCLGTTRVAVSGSSARKPRSALIEVRAMPVTLQLRDPKHGKPGRLACHAVSFEEVSTFPADEQPIRWVLLTTWPATDLVSATRVGQAYALRWRIEEVHRCWKSQCRVEASGLRFDAFKTWCALLLSVAVRTERLKRLSRETPDRPAEEEFNPDELEAMLLLCRRAKRRKNPDAPVTLGEAVLWVAELGGYMGPTPSRGPPGTKVISRGLDRLSAYAEAVAAMRGRVE